MYKIQTLDKISSTGLGLFPEKFYEVSPQFDNPDGYLVRSYKMHEMVFSQNLKAIARAGAGVNNIPIEVCTQKGIPVFNTPGANANGVKELVIASLILSSRKIYDGISWAKSLKGNGSEVMKMVESGKSSFEGPEILGKRLGVIGLGAIGVMVANDAISLGMDVVGYDPYISINAAWQLSRRCEQAISLEQILSTCDYISIHVPLSEKTRGLLNKEKFNIMKKGIRIINLARDGIINNQDLLSALDSGVVASYVTDFPEDELLSHPNIIPIPHLGASTPESEENCALMAVNQLRDFLETGNIKNSVNFPDCVLPLIGGMRIITAHDNVPNMVGQITTTLASKSINISEMMNRHKDSLGYTVIDVDGVIGQNICLDLLKINGLRMARVLG